MYFFYYFPVGLDVKRKRRATITWLLAGFMIILFFIYRYRPDGSGWNLLNCIFLPLDPSLATAVTHVFLHAGYMHLIGNAVYLIVFGRVVEERFGPGRFFAIFILSAAAGAYTHMMLTSLFAPEFLRYGVIGASGATSGLLGAFMMRFYYSRIRIAYWVFFPLQAVNRAGTTYVPAICAVLLWLVFQGVMTVVQFGAGGVRVAYSIHVGGFASGALLAWMFGAVPAARAERHLVKARRFFECSNWFGSQGEYINYLDMRPDDSAVHAEAARAFLCSSEMGRVRYHYGEAIRLLMDRGLRGEAEGVFTEAMRAAPGYCLEEKLHLDLAYRMERSLKFRSAMSAYDCFVNMYPRSDEVPFIYLRMAGILERRMERHHEAYRLYRRLVEDFPGDAWTDFARSEMERLRIMGFAVSTG